jgi:hypothetical protein
MTLIKTSILSFITTVIKIVSALVINKAFTIVLFVINSLLLSILNGRFDRSNICFCNKLSDLYDCNLCTFKEKDEYILARVIK